MSGVGSSTISGTPSAFLSFSPAVALGRKSATAAAMTTDVGGVEAAEHRVVHLLGGLDPHDVDAGGQSAGRGGDERDRRAPGRGLASATAWPIFPDERLPTKRTGSIGLAGAARGHEDPDARRGRGLG